MYGRLDKDHMSVEEIARATKELALLSEETTVEYEDFLEAQRKRNKELTRVQNLLIMQKMNTD